ADSNQTITASARRGNMARYPGEEMSSRQKRVVMVMAWCWAMGMERDRQTELVQYGPVVTFLDRVVRVLVPVLVGTTELCGPLFTLVSALTGVLGAFKKAKTHTCDLVAWGYHEPEPCAYQDQKELDRYVLGEKVINTLLKGMFELAARPQTLVVDAATSRTPPRRPSRVAVPSEKGLHLVRRWSLGNGPLLMEPIKENLEVLDVFWVRIWVAACHTQGLPVLFAQMLHRGCARERGSTRGSVVRRERGYGISGHLLHIGWRHFLCPEREEEPTVRVDSHVVCVLVNESKAGWSVGISWVVH
ncbi:15439_t:CDS:2, partial [Acaulospora colombiana]